MGKAIRHGWVCVWLVVLVTSVAYGLNRSSSGLFLILTEHPQPSVPRPNLVMAEKMMVKKINDEGGINGRPLQLVIADDERRSTQRPAIIARRFTESDKVTAIIGPTPDRHWNGSQAGDRTDEVPTFMTVGGTPRLPYLPSSSSTCMFSVRPPLFSGAT